MRSMLIWHDGPAGSWAVLRLRGVDLATLYATSARWSIEGRNGKLEGESRSRELAKRAALLALEELLVHGLTELRRECMADRADSPG